VTRAWEATLVNLAHVMRKQQRYAHALQLYQQALSLNPHNAGCHAGLAYTHQLTGSSGAAVEHYHKALALRPDDAFASEMLGLALQEECARFGAELDAAEQAGGII
jgi:anaphase-promoting complex subunit 6